MSPPNNGHLQARLSGLNMVAMAFAILNTWIALAGSIGLVLPSGGSVSLLYGFVFCVLCNLALTASLGELASIWPTAGGQYHFVYALCTNKWKRVMSFWVGWTNIVGWLVVVTVQGFFAAQFVCAASVVASNGRFVVTQWNTYLIFLAILTFATVGNIWGNRILGKWNDFAMFWSILGVIIISIILLSLHDKTNADYVFTSFNNETGWPDSIAWVLGLLQSALSLIGFDVILHMMEEMPNPSRDAPRAMIYSIVVGGVTGFAFILVMLFCFTDPTTVLATNTGMPIVELMLQATRNPAATCVMTIMLAVCFINGCTASTTSASRLLYSMARDNGILFPKYFSHITPGHNVPTNTILMCYGFNILFGTLYLGPTVAFGAYIASCTIFLNVSYAFPIIALLVRGRDILSQHQVPNAPFRLGRCGYGINLIAALFVSVTSIFFCFPVALPVTSDNMNYVLIVVAIFIIIVESYWLAYGHRFQVEGIQVILGQHDSVTANNAYELGLDFGTTDQKTSE
ncbi:choline transport protein [Colletotrichum costaricense]|uniref:Choline transport protein n=1 Tax=Colletotrichum costaricense TaxID=1209916 RepID=A0AAI9YTM5_9PEZI|nr:choline transport protein [Colletotrichum costaricense]KAK1522641.1 choline transport protein [Colletotrichum costaricense]